MDQIEVVVHPQSIVHSCVQFEDGSIKAQLGLPDMKLPIQYALGYPQRLKNTFERFNFFDYPQLTFEKPDLDAFRNLQLAFDAGNKEGNAPAVLNAANEVAVERFLKDELTFTGMTQAIEHALGHVNWEGHPGLEALINADAEARAKAREFNA